MPGEIAARNIARPAPGLFKMRLVKGGVFVAARIWRPCRCTPVGGLDQREHDWTDRCDRFPPLAAEIDGRPADVWRVWTSGRTIDAAEFRFLAADAEWSRAHAPADPRARPTEPVDMNALPTLF